MTAIFTQWEEPHSNITQNDCIKFEREKKRKRTKDGAADNAMEELEQLNEPQVERFFPSAIKAGINRW